MYDTIPIKGLSREEWLRLRKNGIGGSDAGVRRIAESKERRGGEGRVR